MGDEENGVCAFFIWTVNKIVGMYLAKYSILSISEKLNDHRTSPSSAALVVLPSVLRPFFSLAPTVLPPSQSARQKFF